MSAEVGGRLSCRLLLEPGERELGRLVDGDEEVELTFLRSNLGDIDVEVADRIIGKPSSLWLITRELGQAADAVPLETAVQRRSGEMREDRTGSHRAEASDLLFAFMRKGYSFAKPVEIGALRNGRNFQMPALHKASGSFGF